MVWLYYSLITLKDIWLILKDYTFMASNTIFITLVIQDNYPQKTTLIRSALTPGSYKTSLDISPPPILLSLHCKQIKKVKRELDGQPSSFWARMHMFLIIKKLFLQSIQSFQNQTQINLTQILKYLMKVIPRTFYLQLLKRMSICDNETKIYPDLNPTAPQESQTY